MPCAFPPKKLRNNTVKVLETRKNQLEQYLQAIVKQYQKTYKPLPQVLLDFLQVAVHVPKIGIERAGKHFTFFTLRCIHFKHMQGRKGPSIKDIGNVLAVFDTLPPHVRILTLIYLTSTF